MNRTTARCETFHRRPQQMPRCVCVGAGRAANDRPTVRWIGARHQHEPDGARRRTRQVRFENRINGRERKEDDAVQRARPVSAPERSVEGSNHLIRVARRLRCYVVPPSASMPVTPMSFVSTPVVEGPKVKAPKKLWLPTTVCAPAAKSQMRPFGRYLGPATRTRN